MNFMTKDTDLNGECADGKGSLNGAEAAQGAIPTGGFDFNALRLSQAYEQTAGVEKLLTTVPVRKPNKDGIRACASGDVFRHHAPRA